MEAAGVVGVAADAEVVRVAARQHEVKAGAVAAPVCAALALVSCVGNGERDHPGRRGQHALLERGPEIRRNYITVPGCSSWGHIIGDHDVAIE